MMKKRLLAGLACAALLAAPGTALADSTDVDLYVNDAYIGGSAADGQAYINDAGRTMVPLRIVGTAMGYETEWSDGTIHVTGEGGAVDVTMTVGETAYTANGQAGTFETAPVIKDGRTYLPARDFSEIYGNVYWDGTTRSVWVTQGDELRYNVIGQTLYRSDANGIQAVDVEIVGDTTAGRINGVRTIDGVNYIKLNQMGYYTNDSVQLFRDAGDHLEILTDVTASSDFYVDGDKVYFSDGTGAGGWANLGFMGQGIEPDRLYVATLNTDVAKYVIDAYTLDFQVNNATFDKVDGVLTAISPDGTQHAIDLTGLEGENIAISQQ